MNSAAHSKTSIKYLMQVIAVLAVLLTLPRLIVDFYRLLTDTTKYAPGYSETNFDRIDIGMNIKDVVMLIGGPIKSSPIDDENQLVYSVSDSDGSYYVRCVSVDRDGVVVRIVADWYQD